MALGKLIIFSFLIIIVVACTDHNLMRYEGDLTILNKQNNEISFRYVLFDTSLEKERGLSNIKEMEEDVLAVFDLEKSDRAFWMKDMRFPIDIIFFDEKNRLISILADVKPCISSDADDFLEECQIYNTPFNAKWAVEANAGTVEYYNFTPGNILSL